MNAVKHAPGSAVVVRLDAADGRGLDLSVRSTRTGGGASAVSSDHDGVGLVTMAERARSVGGDLVVDATDGDWTVRAHLPEATP